MCPLAALVDFGWFVEGPLLAAACLAVSVQAIPAECMLVKIARQPRLAAVPAMRAQALRGCLLLNLCNFVIACAYQGEHPPICLVTGGAAFEAAIDKTTAEYILAV